MNAKTFTQTIANRAKASINKHPREWLALAISLVATIVGLLIIAIVAAFAPASAILGMTILTVLAFWLLTLAVSPEIADELLNN